MTSWGLHSHDHAARKPHVVLLGGQDAPRTQTLRERWRRSIAPALPRHDLTAVAWPNPLAGRAAAIERTEIAPSQLKAATDKVQRTDALDRIAAHAARTLIQSLDKHVRFDSQGRARSPFGRAIYHYTRFSVDALYDRRGFGRALVELAAQALSERRVDLVVAHSFGGTIALRAAWAVQGEPFALITLGTASGYTVERAPMFARHWSKHGIERSPQIASWQHFYSHSDAIVGSAQRPRSFLGIELVKVDTGPFLQRGFAHSLRSYLATSAVRCAIGLAVHRASQRRALTV